MLEDNTQDFIKLQIICASLGMVKINLTYKEQELSYKMSERKAYFKMILKDLSCPLVNKVYKEILEIEAEQLKVRTAQEKLNKEEMERLRVEATQMKTTLR